MSSSTEPIERTLDALRALIREEVELSAEFELSARQFFPRDSGAKEAMRSPQASRRHLEWFLLERESAHLGAIPIGGLIARAQEAGVEIGPQEALSLQGSFVSVFEVTGVERGQGLWLSDLAGAGEYPVHEPHGSIVLSKGDLIAGRIFPLEDALFYLSSAAAFFRNDELLHAVRRDLERARQGRRGVMRLAQTEIESMFFSNTSGGDTDAVGEARRLLLEGGVDREDVETILADLAAGPPPDDPLIYHADDPLGAVLDRLAFETSLDLDVVRRSLVAAWAEIERKGPGVGPSLTPSRPAEMSRANDVADVLAEFERRRQNGMPVAPLLDELEQRLALDEIPDGTSEEDTPAPDFPGVVGAMVEEFLWETSAEHGAGVRDELEILQSFGHFAADIGVFENLRAKDLLAYTCYWLPESDRLENADETRRLLSALDRFCTWVEAHHELPLHSEFKETLHSLQSSLPRVTEANRRRTRDADRSQGELFEFTGVPSDEDREARLRDREGREHAARIDPLLAVWLRPGDRLRGRRQSDGQLAVYCCYPPESRGLSETE